MTMKDADDDGSAGWRAVARALHEQGGVPERRAMIVALAVETDRSYAEIADELDLASKGSVGNQIREYRADREAGRWLAEHGPEV